MSAQRANRQTIAHALDQALGTRGEDGPPRWTEASHVITTVAFFNTFLLLGMPL